MMSGDVQYQLYCQPDYTSSFLAAPPQLDIVVSLPFHHSLMSGGSTESLNM